MEIESPDNKLVRLFEEEMVRRNNVVSTMNFYQGRSAIGEALNESHNGSRDYYKAFGYPIRLTYRDYRDIYKREGLGAAVIDAFVDETWENDPIIFETENPKRKTRFEKDVEQFIKDKKLYSVLAQLDLFLNLGQYACLLIGAADGKTLDQPLEPNSLNSIDDIIFLQPHSEATMAISTYETDPSNPRFGKPKTYSLGKTEHVKNIKGNPKVHHSRVIHIVEKTLEDPNFGLPRLERCFNDIKDHLKVKGGNAEMFWFNARAGLAMLLDKDTKIGKTTLLDGSVIDEGAAYQQQMQDFLHGLERTLRVRGGDVKTLGVSIADPSNTLESIYKSLAISLRMPKRIFEGSERGELASNQDERRWAGRLQRRREKIIIPNALEVLIDTMIEAGALTLPKRYTFEWPNILEVTQAQKLATAKEMATINRLQPDTFSPEEVREAAGWEPKETPPLELDTEGEADDTEDEEDTV